VRLWLPVAVADAMVLAAGTAAIVLLVAAAWPAWRLVSAGARGNGPAAAPGRRSRLAAWLARGNVPVTPEGLRAAL
jgi:peptidoglycan/LPS O-acetylase OafA/YrhL